jgi:C4-dicarboxylate-specific signal transduction histidine kinase
MAHHDLGPNAGADVPEHPVTLTAGQLAQLNRLTTIARFVSGLAHELNNSLQVMSGLVELLADRGDLPADASVRVQKIGGQADRASTVIRQVLGFVRDAGGAPMPLDLAAATDRAVALRRYQLGRSGVALRWDRVPGQTFRVIGVEPQLQQVVINLLVNAEEALNGQPDRQLQLSLARNGPVLQLAVTDSGPGVAPELRERIFEPFFTTRQTTRAVGLGLTVSAAIAAAHGGRLYLADIAPGATFILELPEAPSETRIEKRETRIEKRESGNEALQ